MKRDRALRLRGVLRRRIPRIRRLRSVLSPADVLTLTNGLMGFLAIGVVTGVTNTLFETPVIPWIPVLSPSIVGNRFLFAAILMAVGAVCDALDGMVARRFGSSRLGGDLDTLSDTVTFVVTPAVMIVAYYSTIAPRYMFGAVVAGGLILLLGMMRLARFNANPLESETKTFQGLPTPFTAVTVALTILVGVPVQFALPWFVILAFLMMSNVAYPKSRDRVKWLAPLMVLAAIIVLIGVVLFPDTQSRVLRGAFLLATLGVTVAPFLLARRRIAEPFRRGDIEESGERVRSRKQEPL
ncbi:MAG: CDP-alcohol phosphatidyltransferase family protein [Thermoplasmatota archaeon]